MADLEGGRHRLARDATGDLVDEPPLAADPVGVDVDPDRVRGEWWYVDAVIHESDGERLDAAFEVRHGEPKLIRTD